MTEPLHSCRQDGGHASGITLSDPRPLCKLLSSFAVCLIVNPGQDPADPISYFCAWLALVPQGLCVTYITLIWATREVEIMLLFAGQMGCEALNFLLKRLIKEERPQSRCPPGQRAVWAGRASG